jgi:hypothetical protein
MNTMTTKKPTKGVVADLAELWEDVKLLRKATHTRTNDLAERVKLLEAELKAAWELLAVTYRKQQQSEKPKTEDEKSRAPTEEETAFFFLSLHCIKHEERIKAGLERMRGGSTSSKGWIEAGHALTNTITKRFLAVEQSEAILSWYGQTKEVRCTGHP